jgi:hypothetical protein
MKILQWYVLPVQVSLSGPDLRLQCDVGRQLFLFPSRTKWLAIIHIWYSKKKGQVMVCNPRHVCDLCRNGSASPEVADGADGLQFWMVAWIYLLNNSGEPTMDVPPDCGLASRYQTLGVKDKIAMKSYIETRLWMDISVTELSYWL